MRVLIILGGNPPSPEILLSQLDWAEEVIAADSGIDPLLELGLEPDILAGDLDSLRSDISNLRCQVEHDRSQYATDFEKALTCASAPGEIHLLGAFGGRSDHLLTNLLIAAGIDPRLPVVIFSEREVVHRVTPECPFAGAPPLDSLLSLIPFSSCSAVVSTGLEWNLDSTTMGIGAQLGQSNIVVAPVRVEIGSGCMYCVLQSPD